MFTSGVQEGTEHCREDHCQAIHCQFLKLGGSLITDKNRPHSVRAEVLARLAQEIAFARASQPSLLLLLGHGSGSFGHIPAKKYGTRQGVHSAEQWQGFAEVWKEAAALNRLVMDALHLAGLPAVALPASAALTARDGKVFSWDVTPIRCALQSGLLPVIYGDTVFDQVRGGTILSTEDLFTYLARQFKPTRLLLAGLEAGVWADFPQRTRLIAQIKPVNFPAIEDALGGSIAVDVTGGMASKVRQMLALAQDVPDLEVLIFSAEEPGLLSRVLTGETAGTQILGQ